ncbi:MAG: T9SS type A sorting domain-containing protein [Bacteroidetes bacterium]|nr:T9SS type A sorting domain-containing protein [Bacteroidota bacterium]
MKNKFKILIAFVFVFITTKNIYAQAGTPDPTFGIGGTIRENTFNGYGYSIMLPDEKILVIGSYGGLCLDRFNTDGSYDESFGMNGRSSISLKGKLAGVENNKTYSLLDDGKIVCAAMYYPTGVFGKLNLAVVRTDSIGNLDSSFGNNGFDTLELDNATIATGLVVQPDGKIVISGDVKKSAYDEKRTFICRYMPDGGLDPSFGVGGIVITTYTNATNSNSLIINAAGKLIRGSNNNIYDTHSSFMLESFNTDGSKDISFGENGVAKYIFGLGQDGYWNSVMYMMAQQPDGKITCCGESGKGDEESMALCRFNIDGSIDGSFGEGGGIIVPFKNNSNTVSKVYELCFQPDGKIITIAGIHESSLRGINLVRYTSSGQIDPTFGENGYGGVNNDTADIGASSIHLLSNGKIFTTGQLLTYIGQKTYTLLARFNNDNVLAAHFKDLKAIRENDAITISWQTLNEDNTKSFTVERSGNGKDFLGITTLPAKHAAGNAYSYTDKNPLNGDNYYRIKENAANGTNTYSQILKVTFADSQTISLYPNPAKNTVTLKGLNINATATIKITDMQGREISKQNFSNTSSTTLSIKTLAQGSYFILVEQEGKLTKLRLVKE